MSDVTTNHLIPYLEGTDPAADVDLGMQNMAEHLDGIITAHDSGTLASRPVSTVESPGIHGRLYRVTTGADAGIVYFDTGTGWIPFNGSMQDTLASRPAANAVPQGTVFFATDTGDASRSNGTTWFTLTPANRSAFSAQRIGTEAITTTFTKVALTAETYDLGGDFASQKFTAPVKGLYKFEARFTVDSGMASTERLLAILRKNGSTDYNLAALTGGGGDPAYLIGQYTMILAAADYIELFVANDSGDSFNLAGSELNGVLLAQIP